MNKHAFYIAVALVVSLCGASYVATSTPSQAQPAPDAQPAQPAPSVQPKQPAQPTQPAPSGQMMKPMQSGQPIQQSTMPAPIDCSRLTKDEMAFVTQFTDVNNKIVFCTKLIPDQRTKVMTMSRQPDENGNMMTADQAMQKFMKDNNIPAPAAPAPGAPSPRRPATGGGCSVQ